MIDLQDDAPILLQANARVYDWNEVKDQLVFSDGNEVNIYTPDSHTTNFVTRQGDSIQSIAWLPSGDSIFVGTATTFSAIEPYRIAKQRVVTQLADMQDLQMMWIGEDEKTAIFYGKKDGATGFYSLELTR